MTLPVCCRWFPVGARLEVPDAAPQGRRVNAIGVPVTPGPEAGRFALQSGAALPKRRAKQRRKTPAEIAAAHGLRVDAVGAIAAERFLAFVWRIAGRPTVARAEWQRARPLMVILDNYAVPTRKTVAETRPQLKAAGVQLGDLPA